MGSLPRKTRSVRRFDQLVGNVGHVRILRLQKHRQMPITIRFQYPNILHYIRNPIRIETDMIRIKCIQGITPHGLGRRINSPLPLRLLFAGPRGIPRTQKPMRHVSIKMLEQPLRLGPITPHQPIHHRGPIHLHCERLQRGQPPDGLLDQVPLPKRQMEVIHRVPCMSHHSGKQFPFTHLYFPLLHGLQQSQKPIKLIGRGGLVKTRR